MKSKKDSQNSLQHKSRFKEKENKKHKKLKIFITIIAIILLIVIILLVVAYSYFNSILGKLQYEPITNNLNELGIDEASNNNQQLSNYRNIAILGLDSRYDTYDPDYRTDCIIVASINKENNEVQLFSIYRDTYVQMDLNGETILDKINHAYYNGVENTLKTINENLDLNITEYVMADFTAIADLVDAVGGVEIDVDDQEIKYINYGVKDVSKVIGRTTENVINTGLQTLDGIQAVAYCRIRQTDGFDYKRTERMREVLQKVVNKIKNLDFVSINNLLNSFLPKIRTNITENEIKSLIPMALSLNIKKSFGWPYTTTGDWMDGDFYGPATTLESNVKKLHEEVFGQNNYEVPDKIKEISNKIIEKTGVK